MTSLDAGLAELMTQIALVTGASSGIGRGIAHALARCGFDVALAGRRSDQLMLVAESLRRYDVRTTVCVSDLSESSGCERLLSDVRDRWGPVSCLVHSAAVLARGELSHRGSEVSLAVATNLLAPMELTRLALDDLAATKGSVVFVASTAGRVPFPYTSLYCATKHGLVGFAESIRYELKDHGVHVLVAYPPMTDTPMTSPMADAIGLAASKLASPDHVAEQIIAAMLAGQKTYWGSWKDRLLAGCQDAFPGTLNWLFRQNQNWFRKLMTPTVSTEQLPRPETCESGSVQDSDQT